MKKSTSNLVFTEVHRPHLIKSLGSLPHDGEVKNTSSGYIYADIDNEFIHRAFPLICIKDIQKPNYFNEDTNHIGAHIRVKGSGSKLPEVNI